MPSAMAQDCGLQLWLAKPPAVMALCPSQASPLLRAPGQLTCCWTTLQVCLPEDRLPARAVSTQSLTAGIAEPHLGACTGRLAGAAPWHSGHHDSDMVPEANRKFPRAPAGLHCAARKPQQFTWSHNADSKSAPC